MMVNEIADAPGEEQHEYQREDYRRDHHAELTRHAHGGNHRVQREHDVQQENLDHHRGEFRRDAAGDFALLAFKLFVNLVRAFPQQKQPAANQNQITTGHAVRLVRIPSVGISKNGLVSLTIHAKPHNSSTRVMSAKLSPV
jgi:hypothetical protein